MASDKCLGLKAHLAFSGLHFARSFCARLDAATRIVPCWGIAQVTSDDPNRIPAGVRPVTDFASRRSQTVGDEVMRYLALRPAGPDFLQQRNGGKLTIRLIRLATGMLLIVAVCQLEVRAGQSNIAANVLANTFLIQTPKGQGTGFTIDVEKRQYLITARHMVEGLGEVATIKIAKFDNANTVVFVPFEMKIFLCPGSIDVAVLVPPLRLSGGESMEPAQEFEIGQDAYFVGFPFGMYSQGKNNPPGIPHPIGLVKQGLVSGVQYQRDGDADLIMLDGYNIFGFSGGPVTYWISPNHSYVIGVISGFRPDYGKVLLPKKIRNQDIKPEDFATARIIELPDHPGQVYRLEEKKARGKPEMVQMNTGIVHSYSITAAVTLIKQHPIGPEISAMNPK
jgi:hypothetical protein